MIVGVLMVLAGIVLVVGAPALAKEQIADQNRTWGFRFGRAAEHVSTLAFFVIGCLLIVFGVLVFLLSMVGLIQPKPG